VQYFRVNGHPSPYKDESARGYLLRIVELNGFKNIEYICRKSGIKFFPKIHVSSPQWEKTLDLFTPILNSKYPLIAHFKKHWSAKIHTNSSLKVSNLFSVNCRLCPLCVKGEGGYAKADWDFALTTTCTKHQCYLIDTCPHCNEPICWKRSSLDICPTCENHYSSAQPISLESSHPLVKLNKSFSSIQIEKVEQLLLACSRMHRPQDNMLSKPSLHLMPLSELNKLITQSLGLIHSKSYRAQYQQWLEENRPIFNVISNDAIQEPLRAFIADFTGKLSNKLTNISFIAPEGLLNLINRKDIVKPITKSVELGIQTTRLKNIRKGIREINLSSQIDSRRLASVIGVPLSLINHIVSDQGLAPTNTVCDVSHYVFDMHEVVSLIKDLSIKNNGKCNHFIHLKSLANGKLVAKFALEFHHVIELILEQRLTIYSNPNKLGIINGAVSRYELFQVLEKKMTSIDKRLNVHELADVLNTSLQCVNELLDAGMVNLSIIEDHNKPQIKSITKDSLQRFYSKYLSINRVSFLNGIATNELLLLLKEKSFKPCITINDDKKSLYLFKKSINLSHAISVLTSGI